MEQKDKDSCKKRKKKDNIKWLVQEAQHPNIRKIKQRRKNKKLNNLKIKTERNAGWRVLPCSYSNEWKQTHTNTHHCEISEHNEQRENAIGSIEREGIWKWSENRMILMFLTKEKHPQNSERKYFQPRIISPVEMSIK